MIESAVMVGVLALLVAETVRLHLHLRHLRRQVSALRVQIATGAVIHVFDDRPGGCGGPPLPPPRGRNRHLRLLRFGRAVAVELAAGMAWVRETWGHRPVTAGTAAAAVVLTAVVVVYGVWDRGRTAAPRPGPAATGAFVPGAAPVC